MVSQELMGYITKLEGKKVRDSKLKEKMKNLVDKLDTLKISASFSYNQITKLRKDLEKDPIEDDLYHDSLFIPKLQSYFDSNDNFMVLMNEQTRVLSEFIEELIDKIDSVITDKKEEEQLNKMEKEDRGDEDFGKIDNKKESELIFADDDILEEDEEVAVSVQQFLFECEHCGNQSPKSYMGGCRKCGETTIKVSYL